MISKDEILEQLNKYMTEIPAAEKEIHFTRSKKLQMRMANNTVSSSCAETNNEIIIRVAIDQKLAEVYTNQLNQDTIIAMGEKACNIAKNSQPNRYHTGFIKKPVKTIANQYSEELLSKNPGEKAQQLKGIFDLASKSGCMVAGAYNSYENEIIYTNSNKINNCYKSTLAYLKLTVLKDNSSGFASYFDWHMDDLNIPELYEIAHQKCQDSLSPINIEPGSYDVILEPEAINSIMSWLSFITFSSKSYEEKTSFLYGNKDSKITGSNITIYDDGNDPEGIINPFDFEGSPKKKVYFLENGIAGSVVFDLESANKYNVESTGHKVIDIDFPQKTAFPVNMFIKPGNNTLKEMIESIQRGIYVTTFHYINGYFDPKKALMTGLTRDGTFLIENGKIKRGINNLRFTESILEAFNRVTMISRTRKKTPYWEGRNSAIVAPTMLIRDFQFTGKQNL